LMRRVFVALMLAFAAPGCNSLPVNGAGPASVARVPLQIRTASKVRQFSVEVARSEDEQSRGLMFRQSLAPNTGMIFPMAPPRNASFWMKNTIIPLDMIFIRADGSIARIAAETVPYSLEPVDSGEPVAAVLEIGGGQAAKLGIAENDHVIWDDKAR